MPKVHHAKRMPNVHYVRLVATSDVNNAKRTIRQKYIMPNVCQTDIMYVWALN